ncbi:hypothetical protein M569_02998, partial [Genlisea aurea]
CRVCQCTEPDRKGNTALGFLGIVPPPCSIITLNADEKLGKLSKESKLLEFVSPGGEVFVCTEDLESGLDGNPDKLIQLGCLCKNDLALSHYACALRWFINHGSTVCEICGSAAKNIRPADLKKVLGSLKEYETLRERIANGEPNPPPPPPPDYGVDPDAIAAIRRQRLNEIALWFNPRCAAGSNNATAAMMPSERPAVPDSAVLEAIPSESNAAKWAVEGTGILLATGLLTVTLAWLIAPHVGKKTAKMGLHILLGGLCALTVVVFFRFFVLTRIKYGPARYWAILFVFWFLVFGIWASRTHATHS